MRKAPGTTGAALAAWAVASLCAVLTSLSSLPQDMYMPPTPLTMLRMPLSSVATSTFGTPSAFMYDTWRSMKVSAVSFRPVKTAAMAPVSP